MNDIYATFPALRRFIFFGAIVVLFLPFHVSGNEYTTVISWDNTSVIEMGSSRGKTGKSLAHGYTYINLGNSVQNSGTINHIEVSLGAAVTEQDVKFGIFYATSSHNYRCSNIVTLSLSGNQGDILIFDDPTDFHGFSVQQGDVVGTYTMTGDTNCVGRSTDDSGEGFCFYHGDATDGSEFDFSGKDSAEDISVFMTGTSTTNIWQTSLPGQPDKIFFDTTPGTYHSSKRYLDAPLDWHWSSDTLYVYSEKDPSDVYSSVTAETVDSLYPVTMYGDTPVDSDTGNLLRWIMRDGLQYVMYTENYTNGAWHIKKKVSIDGIAWGPVGNSLLAVGGFGEFDEKGQADPTVIKDAPDDYKMWYDALSGSNVWTIGYATSADGDSWTHHGLILDINDNGWDSRGIHHPVVLKNDGIYYMYYSGWDTSPQWHLGVATSTDGYTWTRYAENPVLSCGIDGSFDDHHIRPSKPFRLGDTWYMLYWGDDGSGFDNLPKDYPGLAVSTDLYNWTKKGRIQPGNSVPGDVSFQANCTLQEGTILRWWCSGLKSGYKTYYGEIDIAGYTGIARDNSGIQQFTLVQNYPNPFNLTTSIPYSLKKDAHVTVKLFNCVGQNVVTLVDENHIRGHYSVVWDGKDSKGNEVHSGLYFYTLEAGDISFTKKMLLVK